MTPERWRQIEDLYHRALELEESRRAAFLQDACAGDRALQDEVGKLLAEEQPTASYDAPTHQSVPEKFTHVVERSLARDPDDRWQTAKDVKAELSTKATASCRMAIAS